MFVVNKNGEQTMINFNPEHWYWKYSQPSVRFTYLWNECEIHDK